MPDTRERLNSGKWGSVHRTIVVVCMFVLGAFMGWSIWMTQMVYAGEKESELNSARIKRLEDIGPPPPPWFESQVNVLATKLDIMDAKLTILQIQVGVQDKTMQKLNSKSE